MTKSSSKERQLPSIQQCSHCIRKISDKKNKPSCVHISLNMYPILRLPPVFGVMNTSICQGSRSGSPTELPWVGEPCGPALSHLQSTECCRSSEHRAANVNSPPGLLTKLLCNCGQPLRLGLGLYCPELSWQYAFAMTKKRLGHPQVAGSGVTSPQQMV